MQAEAVAHHMQSVKETR